MSIRIYRTKKNFPDSGTVSELVAIADLNLLDAVQTAVNERNEEAAEGYPDNPWVYSYSRECHIQIFNVGDKVKLA